MFYAIFEEYFAYLLKTSLFIKTLQIQLCADADGHFTPYIIYSINRSSYQFYTGLVTACKGGGDHPADGMFSKTQTGRYQAGIGSQAAIFRPTHQMPAVLVFIVHIVVSTVLFHYKYQTSY